MSAGRSRLPPVLKGFHPTVASWFEGRFGTPTEPQSAGWPRIQAGEDTLIAAPTGSGKTLAAFLACLDAMIRQGDALPGETQVVYVSPLKALANDVRKNLLEPLAELRALGVPDIRAAVRTGDTAQAERQRMVKAPPHVLVTTPESLYVLLTSESGRRMLSTVRTAIVDEIHAVARDKRGAAGAHRPVGDAAAHRGDRALPGRDRAGRGGREAALRGGRRGPQALLRPAHRGAGPGAVRGRLQ